MRPWLQRSFGRSDRYIAAQIRAAATALKLDRDFIGLGYATFLSQGIRRVARRDDRARLPMTPRAPCFARFVPARPFSASGEAPENVYAVGGAGIDHTLSN